MRGRAAVRAIVDALDGVLRFDEVTVTHIHDAAASTVVCEYSALLHRSDLGGRFRRGYVGVLTLRDERIARCASSAARCCPSRTGAEQSARPAKPSPGS